MKKELAQRIIQETINYALDCYGREYVKFDLSQMISDIDEEIVKNYTDNDGYFSIENCIKDAFNSLINN